MKKRLLSLLLTLSMLMGMLAIAPISISAEDLLGDGTAENPYKISSAADLKTLATLSENDTFAGKYFELTADIVLTGTNNHTPIGTWGIAFGGTFDGKGHTISGLNMTAAGDGFGFFAAIQGGAVIKNLAIVDATVTATSKGATGILIGQTNRGSEDDITIENIYVQGTVTSPGEEIGGVIGNLSNSESGGYAAGKLYMNRVTFIGSATGKNYVAGLIGNIRNVELQINDCLVFADIKATQTSSLSSTKLAHAAGFVCRSDSSLSLLGAAYKQVVTSCVMAGGSVSCSVSNNSYKGNRAYVSSRKNTNAVLAEYCYNAISGLSTMKNSDTAEEYNGKISADIAKNELYGNYVGETNVNWSVMTNWARPTYDIARPKGIAENFEIEPLASIKGSGTEENPYLISTEADLKTVATLSTTDSFAGKYFELTNDITLTGENNHEPIGTWSYGFGGIFDGKNHTISGMHIDKAGDGFGLFGVIQGGAVIKNVALVNAYVASTDKGAIGALVGQTNRGNGADILIENVYVDGTVSAKGTEVGAIIGNISDSNSSYTAGTVTINRALVMVDVISTKGYVGGIVGNARSVAVNLSNCAFYGSVKAGGQYAAGLIVGQTGDYTITNCVVAGEIEGTSDVLAVATYTTEMTEENNRTITNTYVVAGSGNGSTKNAAAGADIKVLSTIGGLFGSNIEIEGWTERQGDLIIPDVCYAPDMIFTQAMISGASVRLDNPTGIRFTAVLGGAYLNSIKGDKDATFGIIIAPTDYVEDAGEFTIDALDDLGLETPAYAIVPAELIYSGSAELGYYEFRGTLGQINEYNYDRGFSAIAYVEVDGVYYYSAYNAEDNSRSIAYVAEQAYEDTNYEQTTAYPYEIADQAGVFSPYTEAQRETLLGFFDQTTLDLNFLSYNVRNVEGGYDSFFLQDDYYVHYEYTNRETYVRDYLVNFGADIIGLQEVSWKKAVTANSELDWFDVIGDEDTVAGLTAAGYTCVKGADIYAEGFSPRKTMYNPIYFKTDTFNLIDSGDKWFTSTPDVPSTIDGANTYKNLHYVVLEHKETGARFVYVNLHLIVRDDNNFIPDADGVDTDILVQQLQVIYLRSILQDLQDQYDLPMFVGGDFNNTYTNINKWFKNSVVGDNEWEISDGKPEETITLSIARDQAVSKAPLIRSSYGGGNFDYEVIEGGAIDLWFTSNMNGFVHVYQVIDNMTTTSTGEKYPSDHLPVKLYVTLYLN